MMIVQGEIIVDTFMKWAGNDRSAQTGSTMGRKWIVQPELPSLLLPCPLCGHRMAITSVTPLAFADHGDSADLEDVTHSCVPCGTAVIRTVQSSYGDTHTIARGAPDVGSQPMGPAAGSVAI